MRHCAIQKLSNRHLSGNRLASSLTRRFLSLPSCAAATLLIPTAVSTLHACSTYTAQFEARCSPCVARRWRAGHREGGCIPPAPYHCPQMRNDMIIPRSHHVSATGASGLVIEKAAANRLGLRHIGEIHVSGVAGKSRSCFRRASSIQVGINHTPEVNPKSKESNALLAESCQPRRRQLALLLPPRLHHPVASSALAVPCTRLCLRLANKRLSSAACDRRTDWRCLLMKPKCRPAMLKFIRVALGGQATLNTICSWGRWWWRRRFSWR